LTVLSGRIVAMNEQYAPRISVIDPVDSAFDRVKLILFQPFNLGKWFTIGFCAFLALFGEGGGGGGGGGNWGNRSGGGTPADFGEVIAQYLPMIIIIGSVILVAGLAFAVLFTWLSSRGRFMFLHCVAENVAQVKLPWRKYRTHANSLFMFRLALMFIGMFCFILLIGGGGLFAFILSRKGPIGPVIMVAVIVVLMFIPLAICFAVIGKFTKDFVVPIMYLHGLSCMESWSYFMQLLSANKARFALYILFQIAIGMAIGMIVMVAGLATCCCAFLIMAIPYIGTVLLLPVFVFKRAYSLYYIRQFGPAYDVFDRLVPQPEPEPAPQSYPAVEPEPEPDDNPYRPPDVTGL
jgi:hypothetical protein